MLFTCHRGAAGAAEQSDPAPETCGRCGCVEMDDARRVCRQVLVVVAEAARLDCAALMGPTRGTPAIAAHRQTAMYLAHVVCGLSHAAIARGFDRDRTTVSHACRRVEDRRDDAVEDHRITGLELACQAAGIRERRHDAA